MATRRRPRSNVGIPQMGIAQLLLHRKIHHRSENGPILEMVEKLIKILASGNAMAFVNRTLMIYFELCFI